MTPCNAQLVRVVIAKVRNKARLCEMLRAVPVVQGREDWNCVSWVREAVGTVWKGNVLGTRLAGWEEVRTRALEYVERKKGEHRFDGKAEPGRFDVVKPATFDGLRKVELIE